MARTFLTEQQAQDFEANGYLVLRNCFNPQEVKDLVAWTDEVQNFPETPGKHMMYFENSLLDSDQRLLQRLENFYPYHEGFHQLFEGERLLGVVSDLFNEPAVLFKDKINFKMPGGDGFKWHQDQQAGWGDYTDLFITALVSIDEVTKQNGPLEIAGGYHKEGLIGQEWVPLSEEHDSRMKFETFTLKPGDMAFFDSYAPHGSGPNLTDSPRRVLHVTYNKKSAGDFREQYYIDKRKSFPPDCEREPGKDYKFRV